MSHEEKRVEESMDVWRRLTVSSFPCFLCVGSKFEKFIVLFGYESVAW